MRLRDFADKLGLSPTTVSRALAGYPEVRARTRQRILQEAARYGYYPNGAAVGLATGKAGAIGVLFDRAMPSHFGEFVAGVGEALVGDPVNLSIAPLASGPDECDVEACGRLVRSGRIDAAILCAPAICDGRVAVLLEQGLPFLLCGGSPGFPAHAGLDIDSAGLTRRATEHLVALSHRRIAMINGPSGRSFSAERELGYRQALAAGAIHYDPKIVANGDLTENNGFAFTQALLELDPRPTAIITGSTESALGVYRAAAESGLTVGWGLSVVAHDDRLPFLRAEHMCPTLTSTRSSLRSAGRHAGKLVLELISGRPCDTVHEERCAVWFEGKSSCPPQRTRSK